jgi:hypothetical protein
MPRTKSLYPYEISSQLNLKPSDPYDPDHEEMDLHWLLREDESDEEVQTLDLSRSDLHWSRLHLKLEASLPDAELRRVLPEPSQPSDDATLLVTVICSPTRVREVVPLTFDGDRWRGDVVIRREDVRGAVRLMPRLVRRTDLPGSDGDGAGIAREHAFIVAEGRSLDLVIDPPIRSLQGLLKIMWEDFQESANSWRKEHSGLVFDLDLNDSDPTLYLNSRNSGFRAALHSKKIKGAAAVIRHLGNAVVAQTVWLQLFAAAVASLDTNEETGEVQPPPDGWKQAVIRTLLAHVYQNVPESERLSRLAELRSGEQIGTLMSLLAATAQGVTKTSSLIRSAERAADRTLEATS